MVGSWGEAEPKAWRSASTEGLLAGAPESGGRGS